MADTFGSGVKHDFDLEIVLKSFQGCKREDGVILLDPYLAGYTELCRFFHLSGRLFGFVAKDLEQRINTLKSHRKSDNGTSYETVQSMVDFEVTNKITKMSGKLSSGSKTILHLHRSLFFILTFMDELSKSKDEDKASEIASKVYKTTLAQYHPWIVQKMAGVAMYMLPSRRQLIDTMCKQDYDKVSQMLSDVVSAGMPVHDIIQQLLQDNDLLNII